MADDYEGVFDVKRSCMVEEKIADCHKAAKIIFGVKYTERTQPIRNALRDLIKHGCNEGSAGLHLLNFLKEKGKLDSIAIMMVSAVVYELCGD